MACGWSERCLQRIFRVKQITVFKMTGGSGVTKKVHPWKRQTLVSDRETKWPEWKIHAYCTAEAYRMADFVRSLKTDRRFRVLPLSAELGHVVRLGVVDDRDNKEAFVFPEGSVVTWDFKEGDRSALLQFLSGFEEAPYDPVLVECEQDNLSYTVQETGRPSEFRNELLLLRSDCSDEKCALEKFAVSNAMTSSVKLSIWESQMTQFCESMENVVEKLKDGEITLSKPEVLRKTGELFMFRHRINLDGDLLDTPDFYWDKEALEKLYASAFSLFNIAQRTRILNMRLNYSMELLQVLDGNIVHRHNVRLEWMIIVLIFVEILFEVFRFFERRYSRRKHSHVDVVPTT